jgi:probable FeS assembly SUF system protein SufT
MKEKKAVCLSRDTFALMVPSGARVMLHQGTEVEITQSLGNSFTVNVFGNLMRIDGKDADAIGEVVTDPLADLAEGATVDEKVRAQLHTVYDPEIPVNIVDLGLIYRVDVDKDPEAPDCYKVDIDMTLTAPGCGMGPVIAGEAQMRIESIPEVSSVHVEMVFDPPWDQDKMSDVAKLQLGMF